MADTYIVSDIHGDYDALERILEQSGVIVYKPGRGFVKKKDAFVLQIGDLANCVGSSLDNDLICLEKVGPWIDLMLVGNHEMPYFSSENTFAGFRSHVQVSNKIWELHDARLIKPAYTYGPMLITHAGITQSQLNFGTGTTAGEVNTKLQREWAEQNYNHYLFRDCGRARYGKQDIGGVLWCDFDREFEPTEFPQVVGHTGGVLRTKQNAICIDTQRVSGPTIIKVG